MTRPWGKLYAATLTHPKFIRSTPEERGAWLTLLLYALNLPNEDDLGTEDDLLAILRREGFSDPGAILQRLVELHWITLNERQYAIHDWADWQPDDPTGAKRKRARRDQLRGYGSSGDRMGNVRDMAADVPRTGNGRSRARGDGEERFHPPSPSSGTRHRPPASGSDGRASYDELLERDDADSGAPGPPTGPDASQVVAATSGGQKPVPDGRAST